MRLTIEIDRKSLRRLGVVLGIVALMGASFFLGRKLLPAGSGPTSSPLPSPTGGFVSFEDKELGVSISYPRSWKRKKGSNPNSRLIVVEGESGMRLSVRALDAAIALDTPGLRDILKQKILDVGNVVAFLAEPVPITLNGVAGFYFVYTFFERETNKEGVHAHYWLFHGAKDVQIVFEAIPVEDFRRLATTFDEIANTFRSTPRLVSAPSPSPTGPTGATGPTGPTGD
ncbi:MAG: hypothetical protein ACREJP_11350, partial [Candidatus Methylomirabilales bacterium]